MEGGTNQITERLADVVGCQALHLNSAVYCIEQQENAEAEAEEGSKSDGPRPRVTVKTLNGRTFTGERVIMATPPAVQQKIHYQPPLPAMRNQLLQRTPQGTVFKCIVYYERAFWRSRGMCGSMLLLGDDEEVPVNYALDDSKPDGGRPAIVGFLPADKARKLMERSKEERLAIIVASYAAAFATEEALSPVHYEEQNWSAEQYSGGWFCYCFIFQRCFDQFFPPLPFFLGGCYTMTLGPGFLTRYGPHLRRPVGRMHFAGTETATEWSGYINGAVQAGERCAREVLLELGRLTKQEATRAQVEPVSTEYPPLEVPAAGLYERYAPSARGFITGAITAALSLAVVGVAFAMHSIGGADQCWSSLVQSYLGGGGGK